MKTNYQKWRNTFAGVPFLISLWDVYPDAKTGVYINPHSHKLVILEDIFYLLCGFDIIGLSGVMAMDYAYSEFEWISSLIPVRSIAEIELI